MQENTTNVISSSDSQALNCTSTSQSVNENDSDQTTVQVAESHNDVNKSDIKAPESPTITSSVSATGAGIVTAPMATSYIDSAISVATAIADPTTSSKSITAFLTNPTMIAGLFDLDPGIGGTVSELMKEHPYMPMFALFAILTARNTELTAEQFIEEVKFVQARQEHTIKEMTQSKNILQQEQDKLAKEADKKAKAGISPSGSITTEADSSKCSKIVNIVLAVVYVLAAIASFIFPPLIFVLGAMWLISSTLKNIANLFYDSKGKTVAIRIFDWMNPVTTFADAIVSVTCFIFKKKETDEEIRKLKTYLRMSLEVFTAIVSIAILLIMSAYTGGASAAAAALKIQQLIKAVPTIIMVISIATGVVNGAASIATGVLEIQKGKKDLEVAKQRLTINKITAFVEQLKMEMQVIMQDINILIDLFSSKISESRAEYEQAATIIKEYYDTKRQIARNISA